MSYLFDCEPYLLMTKYKLLQLQRAIYSIKHPYPNDDLIVTYADFLKVRDYLNFYQFNPLILDNLLSITIDNWETKKRFNRLSLLQSIKSYLFIHKQNFNADNSNKNCNPDNIFSLHTKKMLFDLFTKVFEKDGFISKKQVDEARKICNNYLIGLELCPEHIEWLCLNASNSEIILNRVLRYPRKSKYISNWVKDNFNNDLYLTRRAELVGWIIDQDINYEIEKQILINDFETLNRKDIQAIKNYDNEQLANKMMMNELLEYLPKKPKPFFLDEADDDGSYDNIIDLTEPSLILSRRFYAIPIDSSLHYPVSIPDFDKLTQFFYDNIDFIHKTTMIWAITYSRIDKQLKEKLLKKYYCEETFSSLFRVSKQNKYLNLLEWMLVKYKF